MISFIGTKSTDSLIFQWKYADRVSMFWFPSPSIIPCKFQFVILYINILYNFFQIKTFGTGADASDAVLNYCLGGNGHKFLCDFPAELFRRQNPGENSRKI